MIAARKLSSQLVGICSCAFGQHEAGRYVLFFLVEQNGYSSFNTAATHEKCTQILARI